MATVSKQISALWLTFGRYPKLAICTCGSIRRVKAYDGKLIEWLCPGCFAAGYIQFDAKEYAEPTQYEPCEICGSLCEVKTVKKDGPNKNRQFVTHQDCNYFAFIDMPRCIECQRRLYEGRSKKNGRAFRACPSYCKGVFKWLD